MPHRGMSLLGTVILGVGLVLVLGGTHSPDPLVAALEGFLGGWVTVLGGVVAWAYHERKD